MAQNSWPSPAYNSRAVTDSEYEKMAARFSDDGVMGKPSDTQVVSAGTGLTVNVRSGVYASVRGHAWSSGTSTVTLSIAANSSGSTRVDWVVLRLDRATWTVRAVIRQGTPGAGAPAMVQDVGDTGVYEIPLAMVNLISGASTVTVTRAELYVGTRLRPCTSTNRPRLQDEGAVAYEIDTGRLIMWTGSAWSAVYDNSGVIDVNSPLAAWDIATGSILEARNGNVHLRFGSWVRAGGSLPGTTESRLPVLIPAAYRHPERDRYAIAYITGGRIGRLTIFAAASDRAGQVWLSQHPTMATDDAVLASGSSWVV
jgi:hypothetical protein